MRKRIVAYTAGILTAMMLAAGAAVFNQFGPVTGLLKGNANSPITTLAAGTDVTAVFTGTCNATTFLRGDGSCATASGVPGGANTQIQFNNAGAFGGNPSFTFNVAVPNDFVTLNGWQNFASISPVPASPAAGTVNLFSRSSLASNIDQLTTQDNFGALVALGYEAHMIVWNGTGGTVSAGNAVYINGSHAQVPTIALAQANSAATMPAVGWTQYSIPNGTFGEVHVYGFVNATTTGFNIGDAVYVSPTTPGAITNVKPTASGQFVQEVGVVTNVGGVGAGALQLNLDTAISTLVSLTTNPALDTSISPTWTGNHTFSPTAGTAITINQAAGTTSLIQQSSGANSVEFDQNAPAGQAASITLNGNAVAPFSGGFLQSNGSNNVRLKCTPVACSVTLGGGGIDNLTVTNNAVSALGPTAAAQVTLTPDKGTFTGTPGGGTGFSPSTVQITWNKVGNLVTLVIPAVTGTSNAATFTMAGLPTALQPAALTSGVNQVWFVAEDNGAATNAQAQFNTASATISFGKVTAAGAINLNGWTATGTKGIASATTFSYELNK